MTEAPSGGVLSYLQELLSCQIADPRIESITLVTPAVNLEALDQVRHEKLRIHSFPHARGSASGLMSLMRLTLRSIRSGNPDVVHIHSSFAGAVLRPCRPLIGRRTRLVYCPHGWAFSRESSRWKNWLIGKIEAGLAHLTDRIICISEHEKQAAMGAGIRPAKCAVIPNGIRPTRYAQKTEELERPGDGRMLKVLFVGRFDRQKGFDIFLDVMRRLEGRARGTAVGSYFVSDAEQLDIPQNVTVLGWRSREELLDLYEDADLLLVPSRWEGFGLVAIEAMRAGVPVFASRVGGLQEVVSDRVTGRLFDHTNAEEIAQLLDGTARHELLAFGRNGHRRYLENYTASVMSEKVAGLYESLAAKPSGMVGRGA